jgi:hypothetical protein
MFCQKGPIIMTHCFHRIAVGVSALVLVTAVTLSMAHKARADDIADAIQAALEAYQAGDVNAAKEELDFASQLLSQAKAAGLADFLPEPLDGWERSEAESQAVGSAMMGGGLSASAAYTNGDTRVEIEMLADNPMVAAMAGMFSSTATMGAMGTVKRINRQTVILTNDGELQALINNRILIQVRGDAPVEDMEAYFAAIDMDALKAF